MMDVMGKFSRPMNFVSIHVESIDVTSVCVAMLQGMCECCM